MRILFSNYAILDREGFRRSFSLARELATLGNDVTFLTSLPFHEFCFPYKKIDRDGVKILAFPDIVPNSMRRTGFGLLNFILKTLYILFKKYDIYHSDVGHRPSGGMPILFKGFFCNINYVSEWYNHLNKGGQYDNVKGFKKITRGLYDVLFELPEKKRADGVVCLTNYLADRLKEQGFLNNRVCVVNGGSDVRGIKFSSDSNNRSNLGVPEDSLVFGFVGLDERSGVDALLEIMPFIDALNELSTENEKFRDSYLITTGWKLPEEFINELKINFNVKEFGWVDYETYGEVLNCADAFVLLQKPTLDNAVGWPNRLGDYVAAGRKTITNPYGDLEIIASIYEELFIEVEYNKDSIKDKLKEYIYSEKMFAEREKIRSVASNYLSWNQKAKKLAAFYDTIVNSSAKDDC